MSRLAWVDRINSLVEDVEPRLMRNKPPKPHLQERFLRPDDPSISLNDYLSNIENLVAELRDQYLHNAGNRNAMVPDAVEILHSIRKATAQALGSLGSVYNDPEDSDIRKPEFDQGIDDGNEYATGDVV